MLIHLHRLRERGSPIPRYRFAFIKTQPALLTVHECRDDILNRTTRVAKLADAETGLPLDQPHLYDAQLVGLTAEFMSLSGIERIEDQLLNRVEDFAQTWLCWLKQP